MTPALEVRGFGVEITLHRKPRYIHIASDSYGSPAKLRKANYEEYGTRHRSLMRYCLADKAAVGVVISQDGDVRIITKMGHRVVLWENVRLRIEEFAQRTAASDVDEMMPRRTRVRRDPKKVPDT